MDENFDSITWVSVSRYALLLERCRRFSPRQNKNFSDVGVSAINDHELRVELKNPTPFFIRLLSHYSTYPVHKETVLKHGAIDDRNGQWTRPGNFVCNGPMNLKTWELNKQIIVEKNPFIGMLIALS